MSLGDFIILVTLCAMAPPLIEATTRPSAPRLTVRLSAS